MLELEKLISLIQQQYAVVNDTWLRSEDYFPINMKKIELMMFIKMMFFYCIFLNIECL